MKEKTVVIIGAGPAGLTAAYEFLFRSDKYKVIVLEASEQIGGISKTIRHHANRMDIGGHRFFSKNDAVVKWWENIMPMQGQPSMDDRILHRHLSYALGGPDPETQDRVMLKRTRISRIFYNGVFFDYPIKMNFTTLKNMGVATSLIAGFSYIKTLICKRAEKSLEDFYINRFGKKLYTMFFESYTEKLWGRHPKDISPDWGAQRVKGLSIIAILKDIFTKFASGKNIDQKKVETSLIEEFSYPKYGPGHLWETVADEVRKKGGVIQIGCEANRIHFHDGRITVGYCKNGENEDIACDYVFSSMPLKALVACIAEMPTAVADVAARLPYRDFVTIGILVKKLNLQNKTNFKTLGNMVPDCWIYVQDASVKMGRIQIFNNWSPYMVENPEETVWLGLEYFCDENDAFWRMTDQERCTLAIQELRKMNILTESEPVLDMCTEKVKKAYPAYFDAYDRIDEVIQHLGQYENLYCIGRNGQHRYNNMDHSMETAFEAVRNVLEGRKGKDNVWDVNQDQEYHEAHSQSE